MRGRMSTANVRSIPAAPPAPGTPRRAEPAELEVLGGKLEPPAHLVGDHLPPNAENASDIGLGQPGAIIEDDHAPPLPADDPAQSQNVIGTRFWGIGTRISPISRNRHDAPHFPSGIPSKTAGGPKKRDKDPQEVRPLHRFDARVPAKTSESRSDVVFCEHSAGRRNRAPLLT